MIKSALSKRIAIHNIPSKGRAYDWVCSDMDITILNDTRMPLDITLYTFMADIFVKPLPTGDTIYRLTGQITAKIGVICGLSGDAFDMDIHQPLEVDYAYNLKLDENTDETYLLPEPIENGCIDIHESCVQELVLALPTHVIKDGASFQYTPHPKKDIIPEQQHKNPFAVLRTLQEKIR